MAIERQTSTLPPAQPSYILRGHVAQIHSVLLVRQNSRLLTGDADGWVVYWKVETKRALAVWKAHDGPILATAEWGPEKIITHGRDNNLRIWQLRASDEAVLSTVLPAEEVKQQRPKPWLLHTLPVNTLNFCAFSMCYEHPAEKKQQRDTTSSTKGSTLGRSSNASILIAVPARDDKKIEVYRFPDEKLKFIVQRAQSTDTGMVMAVKLVHQPSSRSVMVLAGYEGGLTAVHRLPRNDNGSAVELAQLVYLSRPHAQPVLSLDVSPDATTFFTSGADAIIAAHRIPELQSDVNDDEDLSIFERKQSTVIASLPISERVSSIDGQEQSGGEVPPPTQSPASLAQHNGAVGESSSSTAEALDYAKNPVSSTSTDLSISFAKQSIPLLQSHTDKPAGLSSLLSSAPPQSKIRPPPPPPPTVMIQAPYKTIDTKHAGQQSLCVRSDGRLLITGGWDARIRIYSAKTLKEVAVLKWHKEGVYAVAFGEILESLDLTNQEASDDGNELARRETGLSRLQRQREAQMQLKHWVVAGAKDGKVSLWQVF
ncbi:WD40-repeat-containing domain protein [Pyrenochaeta sp. MPI-SDFR-AT-0127]|nr:WD40-repeat-containing domain protein [Pyrenochaeta sp. MPI-SDFR-AT-0127]